MGVHRARFLDTLVNLVPPDVAHFDKKCISVSQSESSGVTVAFNDGTTHTADIVIGCDGVRSTVRADVVGKVANPKFTRTVAFRGLISEEDCVAALGELVDRPMAYVGPDRASSNFLDCVHHPKNDIHLPCIARHCFSTQKKAHRKDV